MNPDPLPASAVLNRLGKRARIAAAAGLLVLAIGLILDRPRFYRAYLLAFLFWLGIAVGCLGLALLNRLTGGLWGLVPRRLHEAAARTIPFMGVAFLPVLFGMGSLYVWATAEATSDAAIQAKAAYLNLPFFIARTACYFVVWSWLAHRLSDDSRRQDGASNPPRPDRLQGTAGVGLVLLSLTTTFAAFDWGMSLAPHWFSTLYGILYIVGWTLSALAFTVLVLAGLAEEPPLAGALRPLTFQDLGKLMLTFTMLWAYVNFSQFLIVWSGNLSEETPFYLRRLQGGWQAIAIVLVLFHFAFPFVLLLSRPLKRSGRALAVVALLMLAMRLVDEFWLIGPDLLGRGVQAAAPRIDWMDLAAVVAIGGGWLWLFARQARARPLLPGGEPAIAALVGTAEAR